MRTPGFGDRRFSSTRGVLPMAWTMSPYLPPQGRLARCGSSIASESVVLQLGYVVLRQSVLASARYKQSQVLRARRHLRRLLVDYLVRKGRKRGFAVENIDLPAPVGEPCTLLGVELARAERQVVENAPHRASRRRHDVDHSRGPADRAAQVGEPVAGQLGRAEHAVRRAPGAELGARHVRPVGEVESAAQRPPAIAGRITSVSLGPTVVSRPWSTRTSSSFT